MLIGRDLTISLAYLTIGMTIFCVCALLKPWFESMTQRFGLPFDGSEVARKFAHMGCASFIAYLPSTGASWRAGIGIGSAIVGIFIVLQRWQGDAGAFSYLFNRRAGAVTFAVGIVIMSALFYADHGIFCLSFLILGFADPTAAFVGMSGQSPSFLRKSWAGFCAHSLVACSLLLYYFLKQYDWPWHQALLAALAVGSGLSCIEAVSTKGTDNITVPVASSLSLSMLIHFVS